MANAEYDDTVAELSTHVESVTGVAESFVRIFPVAGASVSTIGDFLGNETLSASDELAARIDELQFDLGEGPCWDALATGRPILEPNLWAAPEPRWPAFSRALANDRVGALFAFPMTVGQLQIGAIDLYAPTPIEFDRRHTRQATVLAGLVAKNVLRIALMATTDEPEPGEGDSKLSRRVIHQATGMVLAQLDISAEEAHLVIQGHAFASGRPMRVVADDIVAGRLAFHDGPTGIEERP